MGLFTNEEINKLDSMFNGDNAVFTVGDDCVLYCNGKALGCLNTDAVEFLKRMSEPEEE